VSRATSVAGTHDQNVFTVLPWIVQNKHVPPLWEPNCISLKTRWMRCITTTNMLSALSFSWKSYVSLWRHLRIQSSACGGSILAFSFNYWLVCLLWMIQGQLQ